MPRGHGREGKVLVKRSRFVKLSGAARSVNRELEAKARGMAGLKGHADVGQHAAQRQVRDHPCQRPAAHPRRGTLPCRSRTPHRAGARGSLSPVARVRRDPAGRAASADARRGRRHRLPAVLADSGSGGSRGVPTVNVWQTRGPARDRWERVPDARSRGSSPAEWCIGRSLGGCLGGEASGVGCGVLGNHGTNLSASTATNTFNAACVDTCVFSPPAARAHGRLVRYSVYPRDQGHERAFGLDRRD